LAKQNDPVIIGYPSEGVDGLGRWGVGKQADQPRARLVPSHPAQGARRFGSRRRLDHDLAGAGVAIVAHAGHSLAVITAGDA
jgi:hypothetical protein